MPMLHYYNITWKLPKDVHFKWNKDGACRENPGLSRYGYCIRDDKGDLVYSRDKIIGMTTYIEAESLAIYEALEFCHEKEISEIIIETDSLSLKRMIQK